VVLKLGAHQRGGDLGVAHNEDVAVLPAGELALQHFNLLAELLRTRRVQLNCLLGADHRRHQSALVLQVIHLGRLTADRLHWQLVGRVHLVLVVRGWDPPAVPFAGRHQLARVHVAVKGLLVRGRKSSIRMLARIQSITGRLDRVGLH